MFFLAKIIHNSYFMTAMAARKEMSYMSKKALLITLMFLLSILLGVFTGVTLATKERSEFLAAKAKQRPEETPAPTFIQTEKPSAEVSVPEKYLLTLTDTQIIIYKTNADGSMQIIEQKPIDKEGLRREDFENLYKGITFDTLTEARETLEDYIN